MKKVLIPLVIITAFLVWYSCKKDDVFTTPIEDKTPTWISASEKNAVLGGDNIIQINSFGGKDYIYFMGMQEFNALRSIDTANSTYSISYKFPILSGFKFPLNENIFTYSDNSKICISSTKNGNIYKIIDMKNIDEDFISFNFPDYHEGNAFAINNNNTCIIPYFYNKASKIDSGKVAFLICKVMAGTSSLDTISTKKVYLNYSMDYTATNIFSIHDKFYCSLAYQRYSSNGFSFLIYEDGIATSILGKKVDCFFASRDTLYASIYPQIYQSYNDGIDWSLVKESNNILYDMQFSNIGDNIIGYTAGKIYHIQSGTLNEKCLNNYGLGGLANGYFITSISQFNGYVYITAIQGVFYKKAILFITYGGECI